MIIRWVQNLEETSKRRERLMRELENEDLKPGVRRRLEEDVSNLNRDVERYAQRINEDLKKAAAKRVKIQAPRELESIQDRQLKDYCISVKSTIDQLNRQLKRDANDAILTSKKLEQQRKHVEKLSKEASKNQEQLSEEGKKLERRIDDAERKLDGRQRELKKIQSELKRVGDERKRFDDERSKVDRLEAGKKKDLEALQKEKAQLDAQRKNESKVEARQKLKERAARLEPRMDQLKHFIESQIPFQRQQFARMGEKIDFEVKQLRKAEDTAKADSKALKDELEALRKARVAIKTNIDREEKRKVAIAACVKDVAKAEAQVKAAI